MDAGRHTTDSRAFEVRIGCPAMVGTGLERDRNRTGHGRHEDRGRKTQSELCKTLPTDSSETQPCRKAGLLNSLPCNCTGYQSACLSDRVAVAVWQEAMHAALDCDEQGPKALQTVGMCGCARDVQCQKLDQSVAAWP